MRIPIPRAPISTQNLGGFSAPSPAMPRDQGPAQLADVGQSLTVAAQGALRVGLAVQEEIDQAILTQVDTVAGEITRNTVSKFQQLAGKNAVDAYDNLQLRYRDQIAKIGDMAKTPVQKQLAARVMAERMQSGLGRLMAHRDSEARNWAIGESDAAATGAVRDYKASIGDAEKMAEARELAIRHIDENSRLKGYGPKQSKAARLAVTTDMHLGAVDALLAAGRASKAGAYLETYKGEIEPQEAAQKAKTVRAQEIGDIARMLDQSVDTLDGRLANIDEAEAKGLPRQDADLARRHLFALENQRDAKNAEIAQDVETEARKFMANTGLPIEANPDLADRVNTYGVKLRRVSNQRMVDAFYSSPPAALDRLRSLTPAQLHRELATWTDEHDEGAITKFLRGDGNGARIDDLTKILARQIAILPGNDSNDDATPQQNRQFELWKANTIAPIVRAERDRLKRDLTPDEFQKLVVNPILADKVWSTSTTLGADWLSKDAAVPLMQLQQQGKAPADDPLTPQDESQNFEAYGNLYVKVDGQEVRLRDIPLEARKAIRDDWSRNKPGEWLSAEREASQWLAMKAKNDVQQKAKMDSDLMKRIQQELQSKMPR